MPALVACLAVPCMAQMVAPEALPVQATSPAEEAPDHEPAPLPMPATVTVAALTPVTIEIAAMLGSKLSKTGDTFPIRLAAPILVDGNAVIPAGTGGMGEVVHAKKGGGSGAPGELVLAARYLDVDGRRLRLRSLHVTAVGKDRIGEAGVVGVTFGVIGLLVTGGESIVPEGSIAEAKTAEAFSLIPANINPPEILPPQPGDTEPQQQIDIPSAPSAGQPIEHQEKTQ